MKNNGLLVAVLAGCACLASCGGRSLSSSGDITSSSSSSSSSSALSDPYQSADTSLPSDARHINLVQTNANFNVGDCTDVASDADITLKAIFGSGMCLQRDYVNYIAGTTVAHHIAAEFQDVIYYGTVEPDGSFRIYFPPYRAGGPYEITIFTDVGWKVLTDIYVGDVYLLGGQSNMEWKLGNSTGGVHDEFLNDADNQNIRLFNINSTFNETVQNELANAPTWKGCSRTTISSFSAIGYIVGRKLNEALDIPIGLVNASIGGTILAFWLSESEIAELSQQTALYTNAQTPFRYSLGWNGTINPIKDFHFRGCLWYQGESDAPYSATTYDIQLKYLIKAWRSDFDCPYMAFTCFELAKFNYDPLSWGQVSLCIQKACSETELAEAVNDVDLGEWNNIHPQDKRPFASRCANLILGKYHGMITDPYPTITGYERLSASEVRLTFDGCGAGIMLNNGASGIEVSSDGMNFTLTAFAEADGPNAVIVSSTNAENVNYIRYGLRSKTTTEDISTHVTFYNSFGLPLDCFLLDASK